MKGWTVLLILAGCARPAPPEPVPASEPVAAPEPAPSAPTLSPEESLEILRAAFSSWLPEEVTLGPGCTVVMKESTGAGTEYRLPLAKLTPTVVDPASGAAYLKLYCVAEDCVEATIHEPLRPNYNFTLRGDEAAVQRVLVALDSLAAPCR